MSITVAHSTTRSRSGNLYGNGDRGNRGETAVIGTTLTVIPWGRGHVSRGHRGDGEQCLHQYRGTV